MTAISRRKAQLYERESPASASESKYLVDPRGLLGREGLATTPNHRETASRRMRIGPYSSRFFTGLPWTWEARGFTILLRGVEVSN